MRERDLLGPAPQDWPLMELPAGRADSARRIRQPSPSRPPPNADQKMGVYLMNVMLLVAVNVPERIRYV